MKRLHIKAEFGSCILHFALCICLIVLSGCGSGTSDDTSSDTGSIAFSVVFQGAPSESKVLQAQSPSGDVCEDYAIETVRADVYNSSNAVVASGNWPCSTPGHVGTISGVPTGSGMYVIVEGIVSGNPDWRGQSGTFTVSAGQTTDAGTVTMNYIGSDTDPPTVGPTNPADGATGVSLDTTITATFSEDVVEASVESAFTLDNGGGLVPGVVTYDSSTLIATLTPDSDLSPSTEYTATITTDVEDLAGIQMALPVSWSFTTGTSVIDPPTVTTGSATSVTSSSATLNGTVNPNGDSTTYYFEYGIDTTYGSTTTSTSAGSGTSAVSVSEGISGLSPNTTYHFRIVATNGGGTSYGLVDQTFTTETDTLIWDEGNWDEKNWN